MLGKIKEKGCDIFVVGITDDIKDLNPIIRKKFDENIYFDIPNTEERESFLQHHFLDFSSEKLHEINQLCIGYDFVDLMGLYRIYKQTDQEILDVIKSQKKKMSESMVPDVPNVSWDDIGGLEDIKSQIHATIITTLKNPQKIRSLGLKTPKGVLLYGPPGTGKTMIAKAIATAAHSKFFSINIPDLIHSFVGESEKTLSQVFTRAKLAQPAIIFLDEIQAMFGDRESMGSHEGKLISQFVLEFDGIEEFDVLVVGATNVPSWIDQGLMRQGRFEKLFYVGPPDASSRKTILKKSMERIKVGQEIKDRLDEIVAMTIKFTGADLKNLMQQAGLSALSRYANSVDFKDIEVGLSRMKPTITQELEDFYKDWRRETEKPIFFDK